MIGCGPRAYLHADALQKSGTLQLEYACDKDKDRAKKAASDWGVKASADYKPVLGDPAIEAVIIVTDVSSHISIARDALNAGKHVILEKPLGDNVTHARELVELGERSDRVAYVCFQMRFMPELVAIKEVLPDIDPVQIFFGRSRGMMKPQFLNPSPFCGIMDVCAHDFDMMAWFMGRPPEAVTAVIRRNTYTRDTGAADTISALIDFGDDRSATVVSSIGASEVGTKCDITGARGNITMTTSGDLSGVRFAEYESDGEKTNIDFKGRNDVDADIELQEAFCTEIRQGKRSQAANFRDGLNSLLLTCACLKSIEERRRVELAELE